VKVGEEKCTINILSSNVTVFIVLCWDHKIYIDILVL